MTNCHTVWCLPDENLNACSLFKAWVHQSSVIRAKSNKPLDGVSVTKLTRYNTVKCYKASYFHQSVTGLQPHLCTCMSAYTCSDNRTLAWDESSWADITVSAYELLHVSMDSCCKHWGSANLFIDSFEVEEVHPIFGVKYAWAGMQSWNTTYISNTFCNILVEAAEGQQVEYQRIVSEYVKEPQGSSRHDKNHDFVNLLRYQIGITALRD